MPNCLTSDNVFILSEDEIKKYFFNEEATSTKPTTYTRLSSATKEYGDADTWFTRTPGDWVGSQQTMSESGYDGAGAGNISCYSVRPCIWIYLDSSN